MSGLQLNIFSRLKLIRLVVAVGMLVSILTSWNLWAGQRWLPTCPLIPDLFLAPPYDYILLAAQIGLLLVLLFTSKVRLVLFLILLLNCYMVILDQNRLQPWFFIYNAIFMVLFFYDWRIDNVNKYYSYFIILQILFSAVYVYSGLQKFNGNFINETFPWFIKPLDGLLSARQLQAISKAGYIVPIMEISIGLFILVKPLRFIAIPMMIIMHLVIIVVMGPTGRNYNSVIWPWNLIMIVIGLLLFSGKTTERYFSIAHLFSVPVFYMIVALFWIMPAANLFNKWDAYLSFSLYSGNTNDAKIELTEAAYNKLPLYVRHYAITVNNQYVLYPKWWCMNELNVPLYPEKRIFDKVTTHITILCGNLQKDVKLVYIEKQKIFAEH